MQLAITNKQLLLVTYNQLWTFEDNRCYNGAVQSQDKKIINAGTTHNPFKSSEWTSYTLILDSFEWWWLINYLLVTTSTCGIAQKCQKLLMSFCV